MQKSADEGVSLRRENERLRSEVKSATENAEKARSEGAVLKVREGEMQTVQKKYE